MTTLINGGEPTTIVQTVSNGLVVDVPYVPVVLTTTYQELLVQGGNNSTVVQTTQDEYPVVEARVGPRIIMSQSEPDPALWDIWIDLS